MEFLVALAILYEVEQHRRSSFLEDASQDTRFSEREEIYQLFLEAEGTTVDEKSEAFCCSLWANPDLRGKCDRQLVLFSKLGHLLNPRPISWVMRNKSVLQWFPQSVVILWLILAPYICERRKRAGKWWAKPFSDFTAASVKFLLGQRDQPLQMFDRRGNVALEIPRERLEKIEMQIKSAES